MAGLLAGVDFALVPARATWGEAVAAGYARGTFEDAKAGALAEIAGRVGASRRADLSYLRQRVAFLALPALLTAQAKQDAVYIRALDSIRREAAQAMGRTRAQKIPREWRKYVAKVKVVREKFGSGRANSAARAWLKNGVLRPTFAAGERRTYLARDFRGIFPYMQFRDADDERVRNRHHALNEFVAATTWDGWVTEAGPPLDWGCRCRLEPVPWNLAVKFGWTTTFPRGTSKLQAFRRYGPGDSTFPRELFALANL